MESWSLLILYATLGAGHCAAMCGGFAILAAGSGNRGGVMLGRLLLYFAGKSLTYLFLVLTLGVLTGLVSQWWSAWNVGYYLGLLTGGSMILFGGWQAYLFIRARRSGSVLKSLGEDSCRVNGRLRLMKNPLSAFFLGWVNGFLPCGFLWLALLYLAQWESTGEQILGVLVFSLMTSPGLLAAVGIARIFRQRWMRWSLPISAGALFVFGSVVILRSGDWLPSAWHHALMPSISLSENTHCEMGCCTPQPPAQ
jgi:sulfite exporter TauE/SafE